MSAHGKDVIWISEVDDSDLHVTTVAEFCRDNRGPENAYLRRKVRALRPGQSYIGGGGAWASFKITRPVKRQRQYKAVLNSQLEAGKPLKVAERIAGAVVNKARAKAARTGKGPKLVGKGGSRRQWYPGKRS